jgi:hypothetical protein
MAGVGWQSARLPGACAGHTLCHPPTPVQPTGVTDFKEIIMGKYFLGWLLGVPAVVLVLLWFFFS